MARLTIAGPGYPAPPQLQRRAITSMEGIAKPRLTLQTPTTAQIRTAIEVLKRLAERISTDAEDSVMQLSESLHDAQQAGRIEVGAIERTARIEAAAVQLNIGATSWARRGGNVFLVMFKTGHALLLPEAGF